MNIITRGQFAFRDPAAEIEDGSMITGGNFAQVFLDTPIMVGKPLTITGGMWMNVRKDAAWTITGGNWHQRNHCSHLHPELIERGLPECGINCAHVVEIDTITVDGQAVDTVYHYKDAIL